MRSQQKRLESDPEVGRKQRENDIGDAKRVEYYKNEENLNDAEKSSQIMLGKYPLEKQYGIPR